MSQLSLPDHLQRHQGFRRTFQPGKLTLGLIAPFKGYPDSHTLEMDDFAEMARMADKGGWRHCGFAMCPFMIRASAMWDRFMIRP